MAHLSEKERSLLMLLTVAPKKGIPYNRREIARELQLTPRQITEITRILLLKGEVQKITTGTGCYLSIIKKEKKKSFAENNYKNLSEEERLKAESVRKKMKGLLTEKFGWR